MSSKKTKKWFPGLPALPKKPLTAMTVYNQLEFIRRRHKCNHHPNGAVSIMYSSKDKSWILSCEEIAEAGSTPRSDGKCFWHTHFDPSDWKDN